MPATASETASIARITKQLTDLEARSPAPSSVASFRAELAALNVEIGNGTNVEAKLNDLSARIARA